MKDGEGERGGKKRSGQVTWLQSVHFIFSIGNLGRILLTYSSYIS
jgi:hypothetical protein